MFCIIEEAKETIFEFSQGTVKSLLMQFHRMRFCLINLILINIKRQNTVV